MQPMAGPCDSPNVVTVNNLPNVLPDMVQAKKKGKCHFTSAALPLAQSTHPD
jgi:hypothetical protein